MTISLGVTPQEIYQGWEMTDPGPGRRVVGWLPTVGIFDWLRGRIYRIDYMRRTEATATELAAIDEAIRQGWLQVEKRAIRGSLTEYDYPTVVLHQATGRPLVSTSQSRRKANENDGD